MEEQIPIREGTTVEVPDQCVTCSEKTLYGVKRWCYFLIVLSIATIGVAIACGVYVTQLNDATTCRLTYTDSSNRLSEAQMQSWSKDYDWPLTVPSYDPWRRTCVCKGSENKDPTKLLATDKVLVWIAPADLVSLSDENRLTPSLPTIFANDHRGVYSENDHVKVCLEQHLVLELWNVDRSPYNALDGQHHCHEGHTGDAISNVEKFYLGWDGALYCSLSRCDMTSGNKVYTNEFSLLSGQSFSILLAKANPRCALACSVVWKGPLGCLDGEGHPNATYTCSGVMKQMKTGGPDCS